MQTKNSSNNSAVLLQKSSCTRLRRIQNLSGNVQTKTVHTTSFLVSGQFFLVPALDQELPVDICCRRVFCTYFRPCSEIATKYLSKNEVDLFHTISGSLYFLGKLQNLLQKNQDCNGSQKNNNHHFINKMEAWVQVSLKHICQVKPRHTFLRPSPPFLANCI